MSFQDRSTRRMTGEGQLWDGLYPLDLHDEALVARKEAVDTSRLWHWRMGCPLDRVLQSSDMSLSHDSSSCDPCPFAKQHKLPFPKHLHKSTELFAFVHSDVWGNSPVDSREGFRYFLTFINDKSRATRLYLLNYKSEVLTVF